MKRYLALGLIILLAGCPQTSQPGANQNPTVATGAGIIASNTASLSGHVKIPARLISENGAGLISENGAGLISEHGAGYVALGRHASGRRIATLGEIALANSLVYLLNPNEQFLADANGRRIMTATDANGDYMLSAAVPANTQILVSAMLSGNRRMIGYALTRHGDNKVNVGIASTYATEFFRMMATKSNKTMADYPEAMTKLAVIIDETQKLLDDGKLPIPDLTIGNAAAMNQRYLAVFGSQSQRLSDLWADLLGRRLVALSTIAGNYSTDSLQESGKATEIGLNSPSGVAVDRQGNIYVAVQLSHIIRKVSPDGNSTVLGTFRGDGSIGIPDRSPDGVPVTELSIPSPLALTCDPDGNLIVVLATPVTADHNNLLLFICQKAGRYFGKTMQDGHAYLLGHDEMSDGPSSPASSPSILASRYQDGPIDSARFRSPHGVCSDDVGNLYVADRRNNLIRRIDRSTGMVTTVAGRLKTDSYGTYGDPLFDWSGIDNGDGGLAKGAVLNKPFSVAWRRVDAGTQELFVWEGATIDPDHPSLMQAGNAIRRIRITGDNYANGIISTLAGGKDSLRGFAGDHGLASAAKISLVNPAVSQDVPSGGLALSPDGHTLYFCDTLNFRIRAIDLDAVGGPTIDTACGGGDVEGDSEALLAKLKNVSGLTVDTAGGLYLCDQVSQVVRKLNLQFGH